MGPQRFPADQRSLTRQMASVPKSASMGPQRFPADQLLQTLSFWCACHKLQWGRSDFLRINQPRRNEQVSNV